MKRKLRHQGKKRVEVAKAEVQKLLKAHFIRECQYSDWLSNLVLVKSTMASGECVFISLT